MANLSSYLGLLFNIYMLLKYVNATVSESYFEPLVKDLNWRYQT